MSCRQKITARGDYLTSGNFNISYSELLWGAKTYFCSVCHLHPLVYRELLGVCGKGFRCPRVNVSVERSSHFSKIYFSSIYLRGNLKEMRRLQVLSSFLRLMIKDSQPTRTCSRVLHVSTNARLTSVFARKSRGVMILSLKLFSSLYTKIPQPRLCPLLGIILISLLTFLG